MCSCVVSCCRSLSRRRDTDPGFKKMRRGAFLDIQKSSYAINAYYVHMQYVTLFTLARRYSVKPRSPTSDF